MTERGGPQFIPRPDNWRLGSPAPWANQEGLDDLDLAHIISHFSQRDVPRTRGLADAAKGRSAVLMCLYPHGNDVNVILTRRSAKLRSHTFEVSFPGGREDPDDDDLWTTALREAHEEIDLQPSLPRHVGELDRFVTVGSQSLIHPFVAMVDERPQLTKSEAEVSEIIEVSLGELLLDEVWREEIWTMGEHTRAITFFELFGNTVWGATAAILRQFLTEVTGSDERPFPAQ